MMPVRNDVRSCDWKVRMLQLRQEHRRHSVQRGAALTFDGGEHAARIEPFDRTQRGAVREGAEHADHAAETMKQRDAETQPIVRRVAQLPAERLTVVDDVAAGEHDALRKARRARRVLHVDDVVDGHGRGAGIELVFSDA